ncbi:unnamed protein product, partial [Ixodes persulcatus]
SIGQRTIYQQALTTCGQISFPHEVRALRVRRNEIRLHISATVATRRQRGVLVYIGRINHMVYSSVKHEVQQGNTFLSKSMQDSKSACTEKS